MKAKRILAMLMAGALLLGTAAGCGSSGTTSSTSGGTDSTTTGGTTDNTDNGGKSDAKLTIWVYGWEKASADKIQEDTAAYKEATGVEVTVVPIASDSYSTKIQATLAGGNNPDLAFVDAGVQSTQLASKGKLLALKEYGVEEYKDKFYDSVWDTMVYKDDVYGLRITSNNLALFYNKEMFANKGLEEPTADWTWDDLRNAAKTLTDADNNIYGLDLPVYDKNGGYTWNWLPFLWQNGGEFLNDDRTEAVFNSPEGVNRFTSGITAMVLDGPWSLNTFLSDPEFKDKFGVAPLPQKKTRATVVGGEGVAVFSNTKSPQEAYDYLVHLTCSDFVQTFWENWITIPPQPEFKDFYANNSEYGPYIQVISDQMECSRTRPFTPSWPQIENTLGIDLQSYMFDKEDDAQAALDKAAEDVNKILADEK